jgi:DNA-binding NarL/FixJ family response regulator
MATPDAKPPVAPVVLLVEDQPLLRELLGQELKASCTLDVAGSVSEAEQRLAARRYDVIVCDHTLPGEQGLDFLIRISEKLPATKRILMTGYANPEFIAKSIELAALSSCLVKPLRASDIAKAIQAALAS